MCVAQMALGPSEPPRSPIRLLPAKAATRGRAQLGRDYAPPFQNPSGLAENQVSTRVQRLRVVLDIPSCAIEEADLMLVKIRAGAASLVP